VNCVRASENVKETAGLVASDVHALRDKLRQAMSCPATNRKPKAVVTSQNLRKPEASAKKKPPPCRFKSETAGEKNAGVGPENARKMDGHPQIAAAAQNDKSAASAMKNIKMERYRW